MELIDRRKKIGKRIRELRESKNWSQQEFGNLITKVIGRQKPIAAATISRYEDGNRSVKLEMLEVMAKIFDVNTNFFYQDDSTNKAVMESLAAYGVDKNSNRVPIIRSLPSTLPEFDDSNVLGYVDLPRFLYPGTKFIVSAPNAIATNILKGDQCLIRPEQELIDKKIMLIKYDDEFIVGIVSQVNGNIELNNVNNGKTKQLKNENTKVIGEVLAICRSLA